MIDDRKIFFAVSLLSLYIVLKEQNKSDFVDEAEKNKELEKLTKKLSKLDRYQHLTNKSTVVEEAYQEFLNHKVDLKVDEQKLLEFVSKDIAQLTEETKKYILNCVIFVAHDDKKISDEEKELIIQISHILGFKTNFNNLLNNYKKSEFGDSISSTKIMIVLLILFVAILSICFYFYKSMESKVKIFGNETVVFSELSFNRYIIYQNTFFENDYFLKQAIFYFDGTADIGFDPKNIDYNRVTKEITLSYKANPFIVNTSFNNILLVDKISPESISKEEASKFAGGLSLIGAYAGLTAGGAAGSAVGTFFPQIKFIAPLVGSGGGALVGGASTYFVSKNFLEGIKISSEISKEEEERVKIESKNLINNVLNNEKSMMELYINSFDSFIKNKYSSFGLEVKSIKYKEAK